MYVYMYCTCILLSLVVLLFPRSVDTQYDSIRPFASERASLSLSLSSRRHGVLYSSGGQSNSSYHDHHSNSNHEYHRHQYVATRVLAVVVVVVVVVFVG